MSSILEVRGLRAAYGATRVLQGIDLDIADGEIVALLGANGAGKTTTLRALCQAMVSTEGSITLVGQRIDGRSTEQIAKLGVGHVPDGRGTFLGLTAEENLRHHGHLYGLRGAELERRIDEMLSRVGLAERPKELVGTFSGGMRRRVELAKGLLTRPRVLLLDEPSTGLDPGARIDLWRYLREIRQEAGVTILVTTHLMDEAEHCDRLAIMSGGRVAACDTPAALKSRIGADVITLTGDDPAALAAAVQERFGIAVERIDDSVRIERERGHEFIPQLVEAMVGRIRAVSLGKPTLEDVFIHVTGHGFRDEN